VQIPKHKLVVFTGVSGSGKSSLAYDTIYQEGLRRYFEVLSPQARKYIRSFRHPHVDSISGISPAIALDHRQRNSSGRIAVGTASDIFPYMRILFAHSAVPVCPCCRNGFFPTPPHLIPAEIARLYPGKTISMYAPIRKRAFRGIRDLCQRYIRRGFLKMLMDGRDYYLDDPPEIDDQNGADLAVQIDIMTVSAEETGRLEESVRLALKEGEGAVLIGMDGAFRSFSDRFDCPSCGFSLPPPTPELFSYANSLGACPACLGSGVTHADASEVCPDCQGSGLNEAARSFRFYGHSFATLGNLEVVDLLSFFSSSLQPDDHQFQGPIGEQIIHRLSLFSELNLGYLTLNRRVNSLSGGEWQRVHLVSQIGFRFHGLMYILDEPSRGMHMSEVDRMLTHLRGLARSGNTVIMVEHDAAAIRAADFIVDMGPGAGPNGGEILYAGPPADFVRADGSLTAEYLGGRRRIASPPDEQNRSEFIEISGITVNNLTDLTLRIPVGALTVVTGPSGAGKSSLITSALVPILYSRLAPEIPIALPRYRSIVSCPGLRRLILVDQTPPGANSRSCPATYMGIMPFLRRLFASLTEAKIRGFAENRFSFNRDEGRCPACKGMGKQSLPQGVLPDLEIVCPLCGGERYQYEVLQIRFRGFSIAAILDLTVAEAKTVLGGFADPSRRLTSLIEVGLSYITLGQSGRTLSGGEAQRLKLARELCRPAGDRTLYILDEPTAGLHLDEVGRLVTLLRRFTGQGDTVVVIEHHPGVIAAADHVIDMGPGGGRLGGRILFEGHPSAIGRVADSLTARFLKEASHGI